MKAMLLDADKNFIWSDVPDPVRKADEVLIRIRAAALNRADLMQRAGNYPPPPGWPEWPGLEVAGEVLEAPAGSRFKAGEKVCALLGGGGYAERVVVPQGMVLPMPAGFTFEQAAAIPEVFATAYLNFRFEAALQPGETVFIQAGASGLGLAAIQLAKHTFGAKVVTTAGSDEKIAFLKQLGAEVAINRKRENLAAVLAANPPNVALDCVGGKDMGVCLAQMARYGRWIMVATLAGDETVINLGTVFRKGLRIIGSTLRSRTSEKKQEILRAMERQIWPGFVAHQIVPVIYKVLPISEVAEAHRILGANENTGKVVLAV